MNKRLICICLFFASVSYIRAQFTIQPVLAPVGVVHKQQLWNVLIVNTGVENTGKMSLTVRDRGTGQELFTALTGLVQLPKGAKQFNANGFNPIQYTWLAANYNSSSTELLPIGAYNVCYILTDKFNQVLAEECVSFDVEPVSPPQLVFPPDSAKLEETPKSFVWIPPTPSNSSTGIKYQFLLAEIKDGQTPVAAIQENMPIQFEPMLGQTYYGYPASSAQLVKGKTYAWQVTAADGQAYAAKTEIWTFTLTESNTSAVNEANKFFSINDANGTYEVTGDSLHLKYKSYETVAALPFVITNLKGTVLYKSTFNIKEGMNYISIKIPSAVKNEEVYLLQLDKIENGKNKIIFKVKK